MNNRRRHILSWKDERPYGRFFFAACALVTALQCFTVTWVTYPSPDITRPYDAFFIALANSLVLLSPYWLISSKWRTTVWIPVAAVTLWALTQVWYFRTYSDMMPPESYTLVSNLNGVVLQSTLDMMRPIDLLIVVPALALIVLHVALRRQGSRHTLRGPSLKLWLTTLGAALLLLMVANRYIFRDNGLDKLRANSHNYGNAIYFKQNGIIPYFATTLHQTATRTRTLSDAEQIEIARFISNECPHYSDNPYGQPGKNLILIIVESLHSWPIGYRVQGREVTPTLNRLADADSTVTALRMVAQTSHGRSSDAHFMYNTGLLPLRDGAVAMSNGSQHYPTLAEALGSDYDCREIIADKPWFWNQAATARTYGFDALYDADSLGTALERNHHVEDGAVMDFASRLLPSLKQPFFLQIVTMTMHSPNKAGKVPDSWITQARLPITDEGKHYLNEVHYLDSCLNKFLRRLMQSGLYRNTVVVIASDHNSLNLNKVEGRKEAVSSDFEIPLIILNTPITHHHRHVIGQVDVFPTLLDVTSANRYVWKGLGHSLLRYPVCSMVNHKGEATATSSPLLRQQRRAWDISQMIITGGYDITKTNH